LDGHGSHVGLDAIEHAQKFGFGMITLPSHTSHVLLPFNVFCFKPFKTTFKTIKDATKCQKVITWNQIKSLYLDE
jgi:isocitrate dehydrogenase kinase/phosphatase